MKKKNTLAEALSVPGVREVLYDGVDWSAYEPGDQLPARPVDDGVPKVVTMRQARLALNAAGKLASVEAAINGMSEPAKTNTRIWWDYSSTVERCQPLVAQLGVAIGLDSAGIDQLFIAAEKL